MNPYEMPTEESSGAVDVTPSLADDIRTLLNCHSREGRSDTPDFILADFMMRTLEAFEAATCCRREFFRSFPDATSARSASEPPPSGEAVTS